MLPARVGGDVGARHSPAVPHLSAHATHEPIAPNWERPTGSWQLFLQPPAKGQR
jgi:hypothetical protein